VGAAQRHWPDRNEIGCGVAQCGACTVHVNGQAVNSCVTRVVGIIRNRRVTDVR
jgi:isoquinoline 1-oxidoreductase subunit alpha